MPTLNQIQQVHDELSNANTLASYLKALRSIGVLKCTSFVSDGHSEYYCLNNEILASEPVHETFAISDKVDERQLLSTLSLTTNGKIDYTEMSKRLAASGVECWTFDTANLVMTYLDKSGNAIQKELVRDAQ